MKGGLQKEGGCEQEVTGHAGVMGTLDYGKEFLCENATPAMLA